MTAKSFWFETGVAGDGSSEYTEIDHSRWSRVVGACSAHEGIGPGYGNEFDATANPTGGTDRKVRIGIGGAIVDGKPLDQDVTEDHLLDSTPSYRRDRITLKADWAAHTVRITVLKGSDGSETPPSIPAPVPNTTVYMALWEVRIVSSGAVTLETDERVWANHEVDDSTIEASEGALRVKTGGITTTQLATDAVETADMKDLNVTEAKLAGAVAAQLVTGGDSHDHQGGDGAQIPELGLAAAVQSQLITNGDSHDHNGGDGAQIPTGGLAANAVDDTKAGNRVPQFYRRQGGDANHWDVVGAGNYTPTLVRMQAGAIQWTGAAAAFGSKAVTFPTAFSQNPLIFLQVEHDSDVIAMVLSGAPSGAAFTLAWETHDGSSKTSINFYWIAIGPE